MRGIVLSPQSDKPIYQQLFEQISSKILKGELESGFSLPPIRTAAKELRISIITVKKAWEELEREGLIYTAVGRGCFVVDLSEEELREKRFGLARYQMTLDIEYYRELGLTVEELVDLVRQGFGAVHS